MCNLSYGIEEQGIEKGRLDLIKNMLSKHMPVEDIMKYSGATEEEIRKAEAQKAENVQEQKTESEKTENVQEQKAIHPKYGTGIVTSEDDMMVEVEFPNYGKKQFIKAFQEVEMIR